VYNCLCVVSHLFIDFFNCTDNKIICQPSLLLYCEKKKKYEQKMVLPNFACHYANFQNKFVEMSMSNVYVPYVGPFSLKVVYMKHSCV
jgi:hypothetical protein